MSSKLENILLIFCLAMNVQIGCPVYECVDCDKYSRGTCVIKAEPGFSCGVYKARKVRSVKEDQEEADFSHPESTPKLDKCVPKGLNVTGRLGDVHPVCCVWSKELGCQLITESSNNWWDCGTCHRKQQLSYSELKSCPCTTASSRKLSCSPWHFVIPTFLIYNCIAYI